MSWYSWLYININCWRCDVTLKVVRHICKHSRSPWNFSADMASDIMKNRPYMHWRHVSITTTPCWGSRLVALRARVVLAERIGAQPLSQCAGPGQPGGMACRGWPAGCMQGLARWLHAWRWRTWQCHVWPPTRLGALLWRHMHKVYTMKVVELKTLNQFRI